MYMLMSWKASVEKSRVGGERWDDCGVVYVEYLSHSHISLLSGMDVWKLPTWSSICVILGGGGGDVNRRCNSYKIFVWVALLDV